MLTARTPRTAPPRGTPKIAALNSPPPPPQCLPLSAPLSPHLTRLARSLAELHIAAPMSNAALKVVMREVIHRNGVHDGIVYVQITRGTAARDHAFPKTARPVLVVASRRRRAADPRAAEDG